MPPKSKKEQEQQAKRLEEQKKKKQQQQARLELERKKYLAQTLPTGLLLPASSQLIVDFPHKPLQFVTQKLKQSLKDAHPQLLKLSAARLDFVMKQLHYFIKDSIKVFGQVKEGDNVNRHRVFVAIMLATLANGGLEPSEHKSKADDERKIKELVTVHCNKIQGFQNLSKADGLSILKYAKQTYFSRHLLIRLFQNFPKRHSEQRLSVYIQTPSVYFNEQSTPFTDLSKSQQHKVV